MSFSGSADRLKLIFILIYLADTTDLGSVNAAFPKVNNVAEFINIMGHTKAAISDLSTLTTLNPGVLMRTLNEDVTEALFTTSSHFKVPLFAGIATAAMSGLFLLQDAMQVLFRLPGLKLFEEVGTCKLCR